MIRIRVGKKMKGSAVAILDDDNSMLLLLRSGKSRWMPNKWGLPGGKVERGENSLGAAIREAKEETDLDLEPVDMKRLEKFSNNFVDIFYASAYTGEVRTDFEHEDFEWVTRADIESYDTTPDLVQVFDWILKNER